MGFLDRIKDAVSPEEEEKGGPDEIGSEFSEELQVEEEMEEDSITDDFEEEDEEETVEWETAYQFCFDMIEEHGYANMSEFIGKYMYHEVSKSPRYRDRLRHGAETIDMVSQSVESLKEAKGQKDDSDFESMAEELEHAERAINAADSLSGRDEMMTRDALNLGYEAIDKIGQTVMNQQAGGVDSSITETDREM